MLSKEQIETILKQGAAAANKTVSALRGNEKLGKRPTKMHIAVVARDGSFLQMHSMDDAWEGSRDIAIAKARTAAFFSSNENALTSRVVGNLSAVTTGADGKCTVGPLWGIGDSNQVGASGDSSKRNGIITFPGGVPLYRNGELVGGVGVSGDAVDQDEAVALAAAVGFEPGENVAALGLETPKVEAI